MYERFEKLYERWHLFLNSTAITAVLPTKTKQSIVSSVISYKAALAGSLVIKVDADYSSKACSTCGHTEDVRLGVFCCSPAFTLCSNCLVLSAVDRHFPPDIAGVATWVATFPFAEYQAGGRSRLGLFTGIETGFPARWSERI
jgi:hypothetical protein